MSKFAIHAFAMAALLGCVSQAPGQAGKEPQKNEAAPADAQKQEPKRDPKVVAYEGAIKGLTRIDGPFPIYLRKKDILVEISEAQLGKIALCEANLATGFSSLPYQAGDPVGAEEIEAYRLEKRDEQLWLIRPNLKFRWTPEDPLAIASGRSLPEAILASYKIEQTEPEKKVYLVNMTGFFMGDVNRLGEMVNDGAGGQYMLDREKSGVDHVKGFGKDHTVLRMQLHFYSPRGSQPNPLLELLGLTEQSQLEDSRSIPLKVTYNLWMRKDTGYVPRIADPRIGYFTSDHFSLGRFLSDDRTMRFITRWNLEKKDPQAAVSEPVRPIVWTLDPSIPKAYRPAVREGILRWNKAFEPLGFKDAVRVQDVPDADKDYDHADGRYNVVRWAMTPDAGYAVANIRTDPFTGEILNASVTMDANLAHYVIQEHQKITVPEAAASQRALKAFVRDESRTMPIDSYLWNYRDVRLTQEANKIAVRHGWSRLQCEFERGLADNAAFAYVASLSSGMKVSKEDYANKFIASIVCHEVGHCLGLRHNFAASAYVPTSRLADDAYTSAHGTSASVMDYNPVNVQAVMKGSGNFYTPTLGVYDVWAIKFGYTDFGAKDPLDERSKLAQIASKSGVPGHAFMTDESADGWDPYVARFDNAKDPVVYAEREIAATQRAMKYALTNLPRPGESYAKRTEVLLRAIAGLFKQGRVTARFAGGITASRSFKGDQGERQTLKPVDPAVQRSAVRLVVNSCLTTDAFVLPESALLNLSQDLSQEQNARWNAPLRDYIAMQQSMLYAMLMSADTTDRIAENAFKLQGGGKAYGLAEHFSVVMGAVFAEVGQGKPVSALRRDLQRFAVAGLITQAGAGQGALNTDTRMLAHDHLRKLQKRYAGQLADSKDLDEMTTLYLRDTKDLIDRFLSRQVAAK